MKYRDDFPAAGFRADERLAMTGDQVDALTALSFGLVTDLADTAGETLPMARDIAARIAALPPLTRAAHPAGRGLPAGARKA